jgi:hypothetical protein
VKQKIGIEWFLMVDCSAFLMLPHDFAGLCPLGGFFDRFGPWMALTSNYFLALHVSCRDGPFDLLCICCQKSIVNRANSGINQFIFSSGEGSKMTKLNKNFQYLTNTACNAVKSATSQMHGNIRVSSRCQVSKVKR